jgi:hypothetical protein
MVSAYALHPVTPIREFALRHILGVPIQRGTFSTVLNCPQYLFRHLPFTIRGKKNLVFT